MERRDAKSNDDEIDKQLREYLIQNLFLDRDQEREVEVCIKDYKQHEAHYKTAGDEEEQHTIEYEKKLWNSSESNDMDMKTEDDSTKVMNKTKLEL